MKILVVVDMQNDFIDGALGTREALDIVENVVDTIKNFEGKVIFTRDTHHENYLETLEGKNLPVIHCIEGTPGWEIRDEVMDAAPNSPIVNKPSFGSIALCKKIKEITYREDLESITLIGLCTDICVISNAMILKAAFPNVPIIVKASSCAGVTPESHLNALKAMKVCQIDVEDEDGALL